MLRRCQKVSKSVLAGMPISTQSPRFASRLSQKLSQWFSRVSCVAVRRLSISELQPIAAGVIPKAEDPHEPACGRHELPNGALPLRPWDLTQLRQNGFLTGRLPP